MSKISRILNPVADEFYRSGIFQLNLFSLFFWCVAFTGTAIGFRCAALIGAVIGFVVGIISGCLFVALCYCAFYLFARIGWVVHPKDREDDHAA